jgi:hypothetical protein
MERIRSGRAQMEGEERTLFAGAQAEWQAAGWRSPRT